MKTIKITGDIEITESQAREIANRLKEFDQVEEGYWEPKQGELYFYIWCKQVNCDEYRKVCDTDVENVLSGNCYKTEALAQKELNRRIAKQKIKKYIWENGMEWAPDWSDFNQIKYTFSYDHGREKFLPVNEVYMKYSSEKEYFKTEEQRDKFLTDCLPELNIVWCV